MLSNGVLIALILVLIASAFLAISHSTSSLISVSNGSKTLNRQPTFVIAGPSDSGKTSLFTLLTTGSLRPTVTSIEPNVAQDYYMPIATKSFTGRLMEFPGHIKLRNKLFETLNSSGNLKGLIYVVDATVDPKQLTETAEFLFEIMQVTERFPNGVDILIACNKSESFTARPPSKIKAALEKEIENIISRRQKSLDVVQGEKTEDSVDNQPEGLRFAGTHGFKFETIEGNVDALEGSVLKKNIEKWECWIDERAVN